MKYKKLLCCCITVLLLVTALLLFGCGDPGLPPVNPEEITTHETEGLLYTSVDGGLAVSGYDGRTPEVRVAAMHDNQPVIAISDNAFRGATVMTSLHLPDSVRNIGNNAFENCTELRSVRLPDSLDTLGNSAFDNCFSLTSVTLSNGIRKIESETFRGCTALTSVSFPTEIENIFEDAFAGCVNIEHIEIRGTSAHFSATENALVRKSDKTLILGNKFGTVPGSGICKRIAKNAFRANGNITELYIPDAVEEIEPNAFELCENLVSVTFGIGIRTVGDNAFRDCNSLSSVNFSSVRKIGEGSFYGCSALERLVFPAGLEEIGEDAFGNCENLITVTLGERLSSIRANAFAGCPKLIEVRNLSSIPLAPGDKTNGGVAEAARNVYSRESDSRLLEDGDFTLYCDGADVLLVAFAGGARAEIPYGVTEIFPHAFSGKDLLAIVDISYTVTTVGESAFADCCNLATLSLGENVTDIKDNAFFNCPKLIEIRNESSLELRTGARDFGLVAYFAKNIYTEESGYRYIVEKGDFLYFTEGDSYTLLAYLGADEVVEIPNEVTRIYDYAFWHQKNIREVTIPNNTMSIGRSSFEGCTALVSPHFGFSLREIGDRAFFGCTSLPYLNLSGNITSIGARAFFGCTSVTSLTLGENVYDIGTEAFSCCVSLNAITVSEDNNRYHADSDCLIETATKILILGCKNSFLPKNGDVTAIGNYAFRGMTGLSVVDLPSSLTVIGDNAFAGCTGLCIVRIDDMASYLGITFRTDDANPLYYAHELRLMGETVTALTIPQGTTAIGQCAFINCTSVKVVYFPRYGLTSIGANAFRGCTNLLEISLPNSVKSIGSRAFFGCTGLFTVTLGNSVTEIGDSAFSGCYRLIEITNLSKLPIVPGSSDYGRVAYYAHAVFDDLNTTNLAIVNDEFIVFTNDVETVLLEYLGSASFVVVPAGITEIANYAFFGNNTVEKIMLPTSVQTIGGFAFGNCPKLSSVLLTEGLEKIDYNAFASCPALTSVTLPASVSYLAEGVFENCAALTEVVFTDRTGWRAGDTPLDPAALANAKTAALLLSTTYLYTPLTKDAGN